MRNGGGGGPRCRAQLGRGRTGRGGLLLALAGLGALAAGELTGARFDVTGQGAAGDGRTVDTAAIQRTIDACHSAGGGTVVFPAGRFLSGTLALRSHVTLHLTPGAVLLASGDPADYSRKHLLWARDAERIAIEGGGIIDGQSAAFFDADMKPKPWRPSPLTTGTPPRQIPSGVVAELGEII